VDAHPSPSRSASPSVPLPLPQGERGFGLRAAALCGVVCRLLGWKPGEFWDATPAEVAAMFADDGAAPPDADVIAALRRQFPDG